jgi:hypothetical protein
VERGSQKAESRKPNAERSGLLRTADAFDPANALTRDIAIAPTLRLVS